MRSPAIVTVALAGLAVGVLLGLWLGGRDETVAEVERTDDRAAGAVVVPAETAPVEFLPVEGLIDGIRSLAEPDYQGEWHGTGYEFLSLGQYLGKWYLRAPNEPVRLGGWEFRLVVNTDQLGDSLWVEIASCDIETFVRAGNQRSRSRRLEVTLVARRR